MSGALALLACYTLSSELLHAIKRLLLARQVFLHRGSTLIGSLFFALLEGFSFGMAHG